MYTRLRALFTLIIFSFALGPTTLFAYPSVYPTGTTIYKPEKTWNGYTIVDSRSPAEGAVLIDMNGNIVKQWKGLLGYPNKLLPGGYVMGNTGNRGVGHQERIDLVQVNWEGKIVWKFNRAEEVKDPGKEAIWMARQHHDYQRE